MRTRTFFERSRGLLGRVSMMRTEGLLIEPCNSIHTFFMLFSIDVVFLDKNNQVIKIIHNLKPFRHAGAFRATAVLELMAGTALEIGIVPGKVLRWEEKSC